MLTSDLFILHGKLEKKKSYLKEYFFVDVNIF